MNPRLRALVAERAGYVCEYCRLPETLTTSPFHVEHILPHVHDGTDAASNLAYACARCNAFKSVNLSGIDPKTGLISALFNPRTELWHENFEVEGSIIVGKTEIGRTTVGVLKMNEEPRIALRTAIIAKHQD